jgi:hypothetical protein
MNRPGQVEPNAFELAILDRIAAKSQSLRINPRHLHVLSREFTGVGSYTNFRCDDKGTQTSLQPIALDDLIIMPNVENGMGAVLFWQGDQPKCLETHTFGAELWDGVFEGFHIQKATEPP